MLIIGSHVSYKNDKQLVGCVEEALSYGANTFMFYTGAPQNTMRSAIDSSLNEKAYLMMKENGINIDNVICHAPYIVNLANSSNFDFSVSFLKNEIERCSKLGIRYLVLHPGNYLSLSKEEAISSIASGLKIILDNNYDVSILLETMAGKGTEIGSSFSELKSIINLVASSKLGVCLDTCHINDAGYDISDFDKVLDNFDNEIGLSYLRCLHINDSKNNRGDHKDRHENIGIGTLGFSNILNIVYNKRLENIPKILETPYVTKDDLSKEKIYPPFKFEIEMLRNKEFDKDYINKIRNYYK